MGGSEMERVSPTRPNPQLIADQLQKLTEDMYKSRYRYSEVNSFAAMKRAVDEALQDLRRRGLAGLADRLVVEIAHGYLIKHRRERMPALEAFTKAAQEQYDRLRAGQFAI